MLKHLITPRKITLSAHIPSGFGTSAVDLAGFRDQASILSLLFRHDPDREHDNDDGDELQQHAKPHELLRCVARAPAHHIDETKEEHYRDGADGEQNNDMTQQRRYFPKYGERDSEPHDLPRFG